MRELWIVGGSVCLDKEGVNVAPNPTQAEIEAALSEGRVVKND